MRVKFNDIEVDAARLLMELHNHTRAQGMGVFHDIGRMTLEKAREHIADNEAHKEGFSFDYVCGRPLKQYAHEGVLAENNRRLFDRDAGEGQFDKAFQAAVEGEREEGEPCGAQIIDLAAALGAKQSDR